MGEGVWCRDAKKDRCQQYIPNRNGKEFAIDTMATAEHINEPSAVEFVANKGLVAVDAIKSRLSEQLCHMKETELGNCQSSTQAHASQLHNILSRWGQLDQMTISITKDASSASNDRLRYTFVHFLQTLAARFTSQKSFSGSQRNTVSGPFVGTNNITII